MDACGRRGRAGATPAAFGLAVAALLGASSGHALAAGWAVGTGGTIMKSTDAGANWTSQNPVSAELRDLYFLDDSNGWVVGLSGTILKTTNGGTSWSATYPTTATLNAVQFVSSTTGWAVGSGGSIFKTTNGGTSWIGMNPSTATFNAVFFINSTTGWTVGTGGAIYKTTNGGTSWTGTFPTTATLNAVYFVDANIGWAVGSGGTILKSTNGGTSWTSSTPTTATFNAVFFASSTTGWAVGTGGSIFKTTNGGTSWSGTNPVSAILNSVFFLDANTGWIVGSGGTVLKTTNAGANWSATYPTGAVLDAVQFVSIPVNIAVTVQTSPAGRSFSVDGTSYTTSQTFTWVAGASHTIATTSPQSGAAGTRYVWASWSDGGAISHGVAPMAATTYTANFTTQHQLTTVAGTGGTVSPATGWQNAGAVVAIGATPSAGYSFGGWTGSGSGSYTGSANPSSVTMNGAITETASFLANIPVTVNTNPAGRSFTVDGTTYSSAQSFSWVPGQAHTLATTSPQSGAAGTRYVWSSWSDGGAISHTVAPGAGVTYTAGFATQHQLTMVAGAGGTVSPATGWQAAGSVVAISATPDAGYQFAGWTGSGAGSYSGPDNPASVTINGPITQQAAFALPVAAEYFDHDTFQAASPWLAIVGFDGLDVGDGALSGNEFASMGLTIVQRDGAPINIVAAGGANPLITTGNASSPPHVLSSSAFVAANYDLPDNFDFVFSPPVLAAGVWVGNVSPGDTQVQFLAVGGAVLASEVIGNDHAGIIGTGTDNRIFYGIVSSQPIERIRTFEDAADGDGVVYDDVQFAADPTGASAAAPALGFALLPPSPNPTRGAAQMAFLLVEAGAVSLQVFDVRGRLVDAVIDNQAAAGAHVWTWRGTDRNGYPAANGVYLVRLRSGSMQQTRSVSLLR